MPSRSFVPTVVAVLAVALVGLLVYGVVAKTENTTLDDAVSKGQSPTAPGADIALPNLDGAGTRSLEQLKGQVVVLNFWASWCEPCRVEAPLLEKAHKQLQRDGKGTVLGATYQDARADSKAFEREFDLTFPSVRDVDTDLAKEYGTRSLPETFVIDAEGRVVAVSRGQISQAFLDNALRKAGAV